MARDGHLPRLLDAVHPPVRGAYRAELAVGVVVALLAATADLRGVIGFSSFAVLVYYLIANASAWTLSAKPWSRLVAVVGAVGCVVLAAFLPPGLGDLGRDRPRSRGRDLRDPFVPPGLTVANVLRPRTAFRQSSDGNSPRAVVSRGSLQRLSQRREKVRMFVLVRHSHAGEKKQWHGPRRRASAEPARA